MQLSHIDVRLHQAKVHPEIANAKNKIKKKTNKYITKDKTHNK